jgi:DNA-directed RNA polymerase subunit RPC12/RpoP
MGAFIQGFVPPIECDECGSQVPCAHRRMFKGEEYRIYVCQLCGLKRQIVAGATLTEAAEREARREARHREIARRHRHLMYMKRLERQRAARSSH